MNDTTAPLWLQVPEPSELVRRFGGAVDIPAFGGRLEVNWAPGAKVTSAGGLAHFAMFLKASGLFDRLCGDFPVHHRSNNSCSNRDILGTAVLAILLGKTRYVHIEALRHDEAARELLGLGEVVSDATVRRAFREADEKDLDEWLSKHEREVYEVLLSFRYILDIDNTVKPIYGHQEGAELGYNPVKPGRPSHNYLLIAPMEGFALGASTLVAQAIGRGDREDAARAARRTVLLGVGVALGLSVVVLAFAPLVLGLFASQAGASSAEFHALGWTLLVLMTAWQVFDAADIILSGALKGAGDTKFVMVWLLVVAFAFWLPVVFVVRHFHNTMPALWATMIGYVLVLFVGSVVRWRRGTWRGIEVASGT